MLSEAHSRRVVEFQASILFGVWSLFERSYTYINSRSALTPSPSDIDRLLLSHQLNLFCVLIY
ncbi:hypothetical protein CFP56_009525 [Quercus suber]|uniref:Uncharacterized protein n=1 Tax=Quercus suber TaxID=58331 RepID=A0AAW0M7C6_QUESU